MERMTQGDFIRWRRKQLRITLKEIAEAVGTTEATVSRWETGEIENIRSDKLIQLSKILDCSPGEIVMGMFKPGTQETPSTLDSLEKDERALLDSYRTMTEDQKQMMQIFIKGLRND